MGASRRSLKDYKTAVFDTETDPFADGRIVKPFAAGFYAEGVYLESWGNTCIPDIMAQIAALPDQYLIYVHNGGKFDFNFLYEYIEEPWFIIGARLTEFSMGVTKGKPHHVWRDSLAIIPVPLADYQKTEIDYGLFEAHKREKPATKAKIRAYLKDDCRDLFTLVSAFRERFTPDNGKTPLTVGQTAMAEFKKFHEVSRATETTDEIMRSWYFGGRTQCFAGGILKGPWVYYDLNSSYPASMWKFKHPTTDDWRDVDKPPKSGVWFADVTARNRQALPVRADEKTEFWIPEGRFKACSHELVPAIKMGMVEVLEWHRIYVPSESSTFTKFVNFWFNERLQAKARGDAPYALFCKFMLNSCYGKLGQDPRRYQDYVLMTDPHDPEPLAEGYAPVHKISSCPYFELWGRDATLTRSSFYNVGAAASITSGSRSLMLEGLRNSVDPVYCDTDSVICRAFNGDVDQDRLGAWKAETWNPIGPGETWKTAEKFRKAKKAPIVADYVAIAGRKTYCLYNKEGRKIIPIKWASKGADLTPFDVIDLANGKEFDFVSNRPTFSILAKPRFIHRHMRATVDNAVMPFA